MNTLSTHYSFVSTPQFRPHNKCKMVNGRQFNGISKSKNAKLNRKKCVIQSVLWQHFISYLIWNFNILDIGLRLYITLYYQFGIYILWIKVLTGNVTLNKKICLYLIFDVKEN